MERSRIRTADLYGYRQGKAAQERINREYANRTKVWRPRKPGTFVPDITERWRLKPEQ
jgi:hypothetical protein